MIEKSDLRELAQLMYEHSIYGLANEIYWYHSLSYRDRRRHRPELHAVMQRTRKYLALHINSEHEYVRLIVKWRLEHNK